MAIDPKNVLRLSLPQWQGSNRPDYRIGGRVLDAIAPDPQGPEETVPVPAPTSDKRPVEDGIASRQVLLQQAAAVRAAVERHAPEAIVTLGGDCHISFAPFAGSANAMVTTWRCSGLMPIPTLWGLSRWQTPMPMCWRC